MPETAVSACAMPAALMPLQDMDMQETRDKRQDTGHRLGLLVAERQASERRRENQKRWPDHASGTWQACAPRRLEGFA
jgi:hypothetical protein